jgi:hypothetical protein
MQLVVNVEQGMELTVDAEQGMEGVDRMESSKSSPDASGEGRRSFELELVRQQGTTQSNFIKP